MIMNKLILAALVLAGPAAAQSPSAESLRRGCGFDGNACAAGAPAVTAFGGETDRLIRDELDRSSGLSGELLERTREGESRLINRTIDESPALARMLRDAEKNRAWRDYYDERIMDAAVASWSSNLKAGYLKGTAAAYATYKTAPPVVDVVAGGVLWAAGVVGGLALGLIASALTGHF
jgi:hypothetical protein